MVYDTAKNYCQYHIVTSAMFDSYITSIQYDYFIIFFSNFDKNYYNFFMNYNTTAAFQASVTDEHRCVSFSCNCLPNYSNCFSYCQAMLPTNVSSKFNMPVPVFPLAPPIPILSNISIFS